MQKLINSHKRQKELNFLIIVSVLFLALLAISPEAASSSNLELSPSPAMGPVSEQIRAEALEETGDSGVILTSDEAPEPLRKAGRYVDIAYTVGGIGAAILILLGYLHMTSGEPGLAKDPLKDLHLPKIWKTAGSKAAEADQVSRAPVTKVVEAAETEAAEVSEAAETAEAYKETNLEKTEIKKLRFLTAIPILSITLAEILIFSDRMGAAVWIHIGTLIALSLSNILMKDPEVHKIHQAMMLLPVLRLINLSMPVFYETTLYTFVFIYGPLAIPLAIIVVHQRHSLEQIGITLKHIIPYMLLSIPLGFVLGLGEYLTIKTGYLIPDLSFMNLLKLTIVMVFFVGLVEELIFRSVLQTRLENAFGMWEAILITSFLFGLMHSGYGTFQEILYTGFVGFIMGLAFYKTRSLPFIAVLHGFVNVFLFGILPHRLSIWPGF
ncbi:type II CAAX endopeptidase family protein [Methanosarcina sp.]|uniref:CPBP family intramembrane glutamic endopeptidase n=1 Tax=Methanosarcina sp. TaxID=2213 RepID=UPI002AB94D84|nr:type II CAAX endopeptidase family protein [Methanosarcina sp.]MDY9926354.1 type II CAAX endopeptidase family protein [Methanosarcina sp.]